MTYHPSQTVERAFKKGLLLAGSSFFAMTLSTAVFAQDTSADDEVVATGTRQIIQDSIALKRQSDQIVDGLSAAEIGDLPALSIGEALETVTGVASHRENGGATEVSIRGLGPYLSSTVINGREATNGSGDRSVNFSQFPSELMSKLAVFKTQDASQIEGGVAGQIQLETLKPLDYNKRRIQFDLKGNINPDQLNQDDTLAGDLGYRGTLSYVDQFEVNGMGDIGISVGFQRSDISQPEAEVRSTSNQSTSSFACVINGPDNQGFGPEPNRNGSDDDCEDQNSSRTRPDGSRIPDGYDTAINPATGVAYSAGEDFVFVPSQRHYRQNDTRDQRDAIFGALQWQPTDRTDINFDVQYSERKRNEQRNDLTFNGQKRNDRDIDLPGNENTSTLDLLQRTPTGAITSFTTDNTIEVQGGDWQQIETYTGVGLNIAHEITDRLSVNGDLSFSETTREEQAYEFRIQSNITPVIQWTLNQSEIPTYTLFNDEFDVNNDENYVDDLRVRIDNDQDTRNTSTAARLDFNYDLKNETFTGIQAGVRASKLEYFKLTGGNDNNGRLELRIRDSSGGRLLINNSEVRDLRGEDALIPLIATTRDACATDFPESSFLSALRDGPLVTNIDDDGTVLNTRNEWSTFNATCIANNLVDNLNGINGALNALLDDDDQLSLFAAEIPSLNVRDTGTIDVTEETLALYAMVNYETRLDGLPMRGNIGVRVVDTSVESDAYRTALSISRDDEGNLSITNTGELEVATGKGGYTEILPSANAIIDINDEVLFRAGIFRGISRADPSDLNFTRNFTTNNGDDENPVTNVDDLISGVNASGNPNSKPLTSWNLDAGVEWYPNEDSIFAVGAYFKRFKGGFENVRSVETYTIDGQAVSSPVTLTQSNQDTSNLFGVEVTASHRFSYLPGILSGLGTKLSYNYADSDFEFEDSLYGDLGFRDEDGNFVQTNDGIVAPANIPGLSKHVFSGQLYYQIGNWDLQGLYKYRSDYFQPFIANGTRIRYVGDVGVFEARASYKINKNFRLSVEAINLFDEPKRQYRWVPDDVYEVNSYGPRVFFGIRGKF